MGRRCGFVLLLATMAWAQHPEESSDLSSAFGPQPEPKVFEPEHNVPAPPLPDDPNASVRSAFEADLAAATQKLSAGDVSGAREAVPLLELSAFVLGGPQRVQVQRLAHAAAMAAKDRQALAGIAEKWLSACGPTEVDACRKAALEALSTQSPARAERIRAADACVALAEKTPGKKGPACLSAAQELYTATDDSLMRSRVELVSALALAADPKQVSTAKKALTKLAETVDGRNGHVRRAAFDARARLELAEGKSLEAVKSALSGVEALAGTLPLEKRYWARTPMLDRVCEVYDAEKGDDACRALEKSALGFYVFHDFSTEHLPDRQLLSQELLVKVNEHYGILIKDCLNQEIRQIEDRAASSYLVYWLVIGTGRVDNFHSVSSELDQSRFVRCLREQFGYWRYPTHEAAPQRIQQGFSVKSRMRITEETELEQLH